MDTVMNIKIWSEDASSHVSDVTQIINSYERTFSATRATSEISMLNSGADISLSEDTLALLQEAISLSDLTDGSFDPTVLPLISLWGFREDPPSAFSEVQLKLDETITHIGTEHIHINGFSVTLDSGCGIDLGGIAKGYAAQNCATQLREKGITAALLSLGGNVQTVGTKPDGSSWIIGIADPEQPSRAIAKLTFQGSLALVTSGAYQRYVEIDGKVYHHILDPKTGYPANSGLASVTILAENGTLADGLSTALFVMGLEKGTEFWKDSKDFEAIFITQDRQIFITEGVESMISGCEFTVIRK